MARDSRPATPPATARGSTLRLGFRRRQRERVQFAARAALQRFVDHPMLRDPALSLKSEVTTLAE